MGRLPQQLYGLELLAAACHRLELQGELWVQLAAGEYVPLVAVLPGGRRGSRLGTQRTSGMISLLGLLLFILAGTGDGVHAGPGGGGGLDLGRVVGLGADSQILLIALRVRHAQVAGPEGRGKRPEDCRQDEGRQYD